MSQESFVQTETEPKEKIINIGFKAGTETERQLSNFANTPFDLDGAHYESVEGFWQSIKFPEGSEERKKIAGLIGGKAKKAGNPAKDVTEIQYQGQTIEVGSSEHHLLMKKAIRAKLEQNPEVLKLLLETGNSKITHILIAPDGKIVPDSKTIPRAVFCQILMDLREEFRQKMEETFNG